MHLPPHHSIPAEPNWLHAPTHRLSECGTYFVTVGTYHKLHHFRGAERLAMLQENLLTHAHDFGWHLEAWAVFSNHYHFVGHSPTDDNDAKSLVAFTRELHSKTARWVNSRDNTPGRKVWYNYRETKLTYERSYLARLNYVHQNAVKHRLVARACLYPWCSAGWFEREVPDTAVKRIYSMRTDQINVPDDFKPAPEW